MSSDTTKRYICTPDATCRPKVHGHETRLKTFSDELCGEISRRVESYEPGVNQLRDICSNLWGTYPNSTITFIRQVTGGMLYQKIKFGIAKNHRGRTLKQTADLCDILEIPLEHPNLKDFKTEVDSKYPDQFVCSPQQNL